MPIRTPEEAVAAVTATTPGAARVNLIALKIDGYDRYWYVSARDDGSNALVGGSAFAVDAKSGTVHELPGSRPPRLNLRALTTH